MCWSFIILYLTDKIYTKSALLDWTDYKICIELHFAGESAYKTRTPLYFYATRLHKARISSIEIVDIECVLLSFLSKNFVSTKWRIYKGILASPRLLCREFRAAARSAIVFLSSKVYRKIKIRDFTWKNGS